LKRLVFFIHAYFLFFPFLIHGQYLNGHVKNYNSLQLISATLQITHQSTSEESFLITDHHGKFSIKLSTGKFTIIARYLGYHSKTQEIEIKDDKDINLEIILQENENLLNEVEIISAPPAIIQKNDTTIYFADSFALGDERKLRELLERMPGLTVEGNQVSYKGKPITKILVENKDFFTGSVAFGINNLPADAVSSVEVLQNYAEVPFLKEKFFSDQAALNIKLKKNKRNIIFGDIESAISQSANYDTKASTYFYNPTYTSNLIVNKNTLGREVLSYEDKQYFFASKKNYVRGVASNNNQQTDVFDFNTNFYKSSQNFASVFQNYSLSKSSDIKLVALYDDRTTANRSDSYITYLNVLNPFDENRIIENQNNHRLFYSQLDFTRNHTDNSYLKLNVDFLKKIQSKDDAITSSLSSFNQTKGASSDLHRINIHSEYYKKYKKGTIFSLSSKIGINNNDNDLILKANSLNFIGDYFMFPGSDSVINQDYNLARTTFNIDASYTLPMSENSDIAFGYSWNFREVNIDQNVNFSNERNTQISSFDIKNHVANVSYLRNSSLGQLEVAVGVQNANFKQENGTLNNILLIPKVNFKTTVSQLGDIRFEYKRKIGNPADEQLAPVAQILAVDEVRIGNNSSYITNHHDFSLSLFKMLLISRERFSISIRYMLPYTTHASTSQLEGLYTLRKDTLITGANQNLSMTVSYGKMIRGIDISPSLIFLDGMNQILINNTSTQSSVRNIIARFDVRKFKKSQIRPSFSAQYMKSISKIAELGLDNDRFNMRAALSIQNKSITASANYQPTWIFNHNRENLFFNNIGFEIRYLRKNSPWECGISGSNLSQNNSNLRIVSNTRSISERVDLLFPRQVVLRISYKF
jgi:CarboxypepD_reg-like domain